MIKKSKSTDSVGKQLEDQVVQAQVAQAKTGFAEAGSKSSHSVSSKDTAHGNKGKSVAKKTDEDELDLSLNTGAESAADPIVLAQAETGTATDAATAGSSSSAAGTAGGGAGSAAAGAATGAEGAGAFALSDAALGTMILAGTVGVAVIASTGGGTAAAAAAAPVAGFTISGVIALGKITDVTGLAVQAYKADGTALSTTPSAVNADGTYRINVGVDYTGAILVRLTDTEPTDPAVSKNNYFDEGTGTAKDIATDLRAVVYAAAGNGANVTVMLTPLTELAVRQLVGDTGGDAGASVTALGASVAAVTSTQVSDFNNAVKTAFGLAGDIVATAPVTVDNLTGTVNDYGRALAAISGLEKVQSTSTGQTVDTSQILNQLSLAIVAPATATGTSTLSQSAVDLLVLGAQQVQTTAALPANSANYATNTATTLATALTTAIGTSVTGLTLSADTGASSKDFITSSTAAQTITGTLGATLGTNKLWGSVDNGATWTNITAFVADVAGTPTLTWNVGPLTGANVIKLAQTAGAVTTFIGATTDLIANTKVTVQNYAVDPAAPAAPSVAVVTGAADATAAEATAGAVTVNAEKLSSVAVTFTNGANTVTKTITGSGAAQTVALATGDQATLGEGTVSVSAIATDIAGNASAAGTGSFTLDTVAPVAPVVALVSGAAAATAAEATAGAVTVNAETGASIAVTFTGTAGSVTKTVTGTGAAQAVALTTTEQGNLGNGAVTVSAVATDVAGNASSASTAGSGSFTLDTVAPVAPVVALVAGAAAATAAEATAGAVTVNAETGASVAVTFTGTAGAVTKTVTGTGAALAVALAGGNLTTLGEGAVTVSAVATDAAGNASAASTAGSGSFTLDTVAPLAPSAPTDAAAGAIVNAAEAAAGVAVLASLAGTNAVAGDTIELKLGSTTLLTYVLTTGEAGGSYTFTVASGTLGLDGAKSLTTVVTDVAGNAGAASPALALTLDMTASTITFSNPALSADTGVSGDFITSTPTQTITATLSAGLGAGDIVYGSLDNGVTWADITSFVTGTTLTLTGQTLTGSNTLKLKVTDSAGNDGAIASQAYVIDNTAPTLASSTPVDGSTTAVATDNIVLTFSENVAVGSGNIVITNANNAGDTRTIAVGDAQVAVGTTAVTINPTADLALGGTYNVQIASTAITDIAGNAYAGIADATTLNFVTANNPSVTIGTDNSVLKIGDVATLTFTLSEAAIDFTAADITVMGGTLSNFAGNGTTYTAIFTPSASSTAATVNVASGVFTNASTITNTAATQLSMTVDTVAPTLSSSTPSGSGVSPGANIVLTFGENVAAGTGNIVISDGTNSIPIAVTDTSQVSFSGATVTINPTANLNPSTTYNVQMASGVINDAAGNAYAGITNATTLNFTTAAAPTLTSTIDSVTSFDVTSNIVMTVSENVTAVAGKNITIVNDSSIDIFWDHDSNPATPQVVKYSGFHGEAADNTQIIAANDTNKVTITTTNNTTTITINPGFDLDLANNYHIEVDAGAFMSGGVPSIAVSDAAAMNFSTVTPGSAAGGVAGAVASQKMSGGTDAMVASYGWWDIETLGTTPTSSPVTGDLSSGNIANIAVVFKDYDPLPGNAGTGYTGIGSPGDDYVNLLNFGNGDLLYIDNQTNSAPNDLTQAAFNHSGAAPVQLFIDPYTPQGGMPTLVDITTTQGTTAFNDVLALQTLLGTPYIPIVSA